MRILVTGGNGFIGSNLVKALRARGDEVTVWDLPEHPVELSNIIFPDDFELIYHLAAVSRVKASYANPQLTVQVNIGGTMSILHHAKCPVIVAGTLHRGDSPYAVTKMALELIVLSHSQRWGYIANRIIRFGNVYGGGDGVIDKWIAADTLTIYGDGTTFKDFIHVDDVVAGLLNPSTKPVSNLCTGKLTSLNELAAMFDKPAVYREPQPGDWSTEMVQADYPAKWTVAEFIRSKA